MRIEIFKLIESFFFKKNKIKILCLVAENPKERKERMTIENCSVLSFFCGSSGNLNSRLKLVLNFIDTESWVWLVEEVDEKGNSLGRFWMGNYGVPIFNVPLFMQVQSFGTPSEVDAWLLSNPMRCPGALHFVERNATVISYGIQTNSTPVSVRGNYEDPTFKFQIPLQIATEREIARHLIGGIKF
jgi:hypothetical protein